MLSMEYIYIIYGMGGIHDAYVLVPGTDLHCLRYVCYAFIQQFTMKTFAKAPQALIACTDSGVQVLV